MKTELMSINSIPDKQELLSLLGIDIYRYYINLCDTIISNLLPDTDIWDIAGRRGKYFHGFRISKQSLLVDLYLISYSDNEGAVSCEFHFGKKILLKILKQKEIFREELQEKIDNCIKTNQENGGGFYLTILINSIESLEDAQQIIQKINHKK